MFNGTIAYTKQQGVAKPGVININGEKYYETVAFGNYVYKLGNIAGSGYMEDELLKAIVEIKKDLAKKIASVSDKKDLKAIMTAIGSEGENNYLTSTLFNIEIDLNDIRDLSKASDIAEKINVSTLEKVANKLNRSSDYLRIGDCCYYKYSTIDSYSSYRGVDVATEENERISSDNEVTSIIEDVLNSSSGVNVIDAFMNRNLESGTGVMNKDNDLAYIAYSKLIRKKVKRGYSQYSTVTLKDILDANESINQYFIQVNVGYKSSSGRATLYNLPTADVEYAYCKGSWEESEKTTSKGIHFFNFLPNETGIRFIISDDPKWLVMTTAAAWYESMFMSTSNNNNKVKIAYGNDDYKQVTLQNKSDGSITNISLLSQAGGFSTVGELAKNTDGTYKQQYSAWGNLEDTEMGKILEEMNKIDGYIEKIEYLTKHYDSSRFYYSKKFENDYRKNNKVDSNNNNSESGDGNLYLDVVVEIEKTTEYGQNDYLVYKVSNFNTQMPIFSDASNWYGNALQVIQDFGKTVSNGFQKLWGKITGKEKEEVTSHGENHLCIQLYRLPIFELPSSEADSFEVKVDENTKIIKYDINDYVTLIDTDYSSSTNFNITITNKTKNKNVKFWGYELVATSHKSNIGFEGWGVVDPNSNDSVLYYIDADRLSSKAIRESGYTRHINLMLEDDNNKTIEIKNLPASATYELRFYSGLDIFVKNDDERRNIGYYNDNAIQSNINLAENLNPTIKGIIRFSTDNNLVYNPYGEYIKREYNKNNLELKYNGDKLLLETYIDLELFNFIYDVNNANGINNPSNRTYIEKTIKGSTYKFSTKFLMQKYTNTENISQIAFYLKPTKGDKEVDYDDNIQYAIFDSKLTKIVSQGIVETGNNHNGVIYYTLTNADKQVLLTKYNNVVDSNFVNGYLLTDKLVFMIKNVKNDLALTTENYFEIYWQPYYKDTYAYLDLNQNGKYDGGNDIRYTVSGSKQPYYDVNLMPVSDEESTLIETNYSHIIYNVNQLSKWTQATITDTGYIDKNGNPIILKDLIACKIEFNTKDFWYQLCTYRDGESHIIK